MNVVLFCHSLVSDWNHGNAHFLRGIAGELIRRHHRVQVYEPADSWSLRNLAENHGDGPVRRFREAYPALDSTRFDAATLDLDEALDGADLVLVHEWNDHGLVRRIGRHRARSRHYRLLFHDTHHRAVTDRAAVASYDLAHYDGVLAFGGVIRDIYLSEGWTQHAWTWHEAADVSVFRPMPALRSEGDLVWIGNWGDNERTEELHEFLLRPARRLGIRTRVHGVRYPEEALCALREAGVEYAGWLPNFDVPAVFSRFKATVHVPRRPYVEALPGIPTIRIFEALASGIPLICAPWPDVEGLFTPGEDFLTAADGSEMQQKLRAVLSDPGLAAALARNGRRTILQRHTCAHRVTQLLEIHAALSGVPRETEAIA